MYTLYEVAPTIEIFVHTLFEWARSKGTLNQWIDHIIMDKSYPKVFMSHVDLYTGNILP